MINCQLLIITILLMLSIGVTIMAEDNTIGAINDLQNSAPVLRYCD